MRTLRRLGGWLLILVLLVSLGTSTAAAAPLPRIFVATATLSGANEVPPVTDTNASGVAIYRLSADGLTLRYTLVAVNLTSTPMMAHIHASAPPGVNAPVVAFLFPPNARSSCPQATATALHCVGEITAADLVGPLAGQPLSALIDAMAAGNSYTNVHTMKHGSGEIRGQNAPTFPASLGLAG
jgi:hypothetical protein